MTDLLASADAAFRIVIDEAKDYAILLIGPDGRIETWNHGAEAIFRYGVDEVVGQHFAMLFNDADRAAGVPARELVKAASAGRAEDTRWHVRKGGEPFFADGVTTAIRDRNEATVGYAKIVRDITERHRTQQRVAAQLALTTLLNSDDPINITARRIMQAICENLAWDLGALWEMDPAGQQLRCLDGWHVAGVADDVARDLCSGLTFSQGEGIPGEAWTRGEAIWFTDISDAGRFPRAARATRAGLLAAFAFPILHEGQVMGVMEFFSRSSREPDQALLPVMTLIGAQIGDFIVRRRTANALRESEERRRLVMETAQDAIFTMDEQSTITSCNPAVDRIFGYKPSELIGRNLEAIIPERFREAHRRGVERFLRTGERRIPWSGVELTGIHRDGHEFPLEIAFGSFAGSSGTIFTGFARDITDRVRAAEDLRVLLADEQRNRVELEAAHAQLERRAEEEAAFRHLASALTGAVEMTDVLHEITNRATQVTRADGVYVERISQDRMVEVVAAAGTGAPQRGLRVVYPGSMTEEIVARREPVILADMKTFGRAMAPYLTATCPQCEVLVTPLVAENETLGALVLLNSRTSGRAFTEPDLIRARTLGDLTSLALRRVRLMEEEREAKEKAETAVRVRDETLGIVSHDLRNPLTKIGLSADLLVGSPPEEHAELIETIRVSARQMQRLIEDLLDVARLEAGRFSVNKQVIPSAPIVGHACSSNEPIAAQKRQTIACSVDGELPDICADRDRIQQVFANLIGNAMKFAPEGGVISVDARRDGDFVIFAISDTGPGIPEADLKNLFRPYWQAKKTAHMGAGLGLTIVRGIVEAHGGRVWAGNASGGGAVFTFTIPRA